MQRGSVKTYFLADGLGSVTHLTDNTGKIVESSTYDPYGKPSIFDGAGNPLTTSAYGNRLLFTGREYDAETGLYYYRRRYYDAGTGRFLSRDPLGYWPDRNLYRYVRNNPIRFIDPWGLDKVASGTGNLLDEILDGLGIPNPEDIVDWALGIENAYADDFEVANQLTQQKKQLISDLFFKIIGFYGGVGGAMMTFGAKLFPYYPLVGGALFAGGVIQEFLGYKEFVDWSKQFGDWYNKTKDFEEEF